MPLAIALHLISAVIWVGGMFFAYVCLRPVAAALLEPPLRLPLWIDTFKRFFLCVWVAVLILPASGVYMAGRLYGGLGHSPLHVRLMLVIGTLMILLFMQVFFVPYRRLRRAVGARDFKEGARQLAQIRRIVGVNTLLGLLVLIIAGSGGFPAG